MVIIDGLRLRQPQMRRTAVRFTGVTGSGNIPSGSRRPEGVEMDIQQAPWCKATAFLVARAAEGFGRRC